MFSGVPSGFRPAPPVDRGMGALSRITNAKFQKAEVTITMLKVHSASIKNYRAIENLEFSPNSINVFVGPNNCGKSSVLEAIALNLSLDNNFSDYAGKDVWHYLLSRKTYDPCYMVFSGAKEALIECDDHRVTFEFVERGFPEGESGQKILEYFQDRVDEYLQTGSVMNELQRRYFSDYHKGVDPANRQTTLFGAPVPADDDPEDRHDPEALDTIRESFKNYVVQLRSAILFDVTGRRKVIFCGYTGGKLENITISMDTPAAYRSSIDSVVRDFYVRMLGWEFSGRRMNLIPIFQAPKTGRFQLITNFEHSNPSRELDRLHDLAINSNRIVQSLGMLKEKIAYFDDIQKTDKGLQVFLKNQDAPLPVSSMGDGFRSLLSLTFMNSLAGEGVIILEEPEVSLHPGFMYILCEAILKNSKESQFFISTHSMDFVRALLNVLKWEGQTDDIHIIRMFTGLATQSPDIEVLSGDDALNDIEEIGRDLRGI